VNSLPAFEELWQRSVIPLVGQRLYFENGGNMEVLKVDWAGVRRRSSVGRTGDIPIEAFLWTVRQLQARGRVTRVEIDDHFDGRFSSAIALILAQVP
jgi:hypothetical protein